MAGLAWELVPQDPHQGNGAPLRGAWFRAQKQLGDVEFVDMSALPYPEYQPPLSVGDTRERGYFKWTVG